MNRKQALAYATAIIRKLRGYRNVNTLEYRNYTADINLLADALMLAAANQDVTLAGQQF